MDHDGLEELDDELLEAYGGMTDDSDIFLRIKALFTEIGL